MATILAISFKTKKDYQHECGALREMTEFKQLITKQNKFTVMDI